MAQLIPPHGGKGLTCCLLEGAALEAEKKKAAGLKQVPVSPREKGDLIMMGIGGFSPLTGFMTKADWKGVCDNYLLADGTFWPIPVTLSAGTTAVGISLYVGTVSGTGQAKVGIYTDSSSVPAALVSSAGPVTLLSNSWNNFTFNNYLATGVYWLAFQSDNSGGTNPFRSGAGGSRLASRTAVLTWGSPFPSTFGTSSVVTYNPFSIYLSTCP